MEEYRRCTTRFVPRAFLIYVNDMHQAVNSDCFYKDVQETEKVLINDVENTCDWLAEIKLSIHFGEDKSKSILSAIQRKIENISKKA